MLLLTDIAQDLSALGGSGWAGAGLLGLVLLWLLMWHLPAKDKQLKELIERHDATTTALVDKHAAAMAAEIARCDAGRKEAREDFRQSLETVCEPMTRAVEVLGQVIKDMKRP